MRKTLSFQGGTIEYELSRKRVKNLNLRLHADGRITVSAPYFTPQWQIDRFILSHGTRIMAALERKSRADAVKGDRSHVFLLGQRVDILTRKGAKNSSVHSAGQLILTLKDPEDSEARQKALDGYIRQLAIQSVTESSERVYPIFQAMGVKKPELKFRKMKSRWGSCRYEKASLSFNTALAHVPVACIDYVVMHEYCHFIHPDHSSAFHGLMTRLMPDWKERKKVLENFSLLL